MHADLESIVCKFGSDPAICLREEAICTKVYRRTDNGRRAIALAHSWNELKMILRCPVLFGVVYDVTSCSSLSAGLELSVVVNQHL